LPTYKSWSYDDNRFPSEALGLTDLEAMN